MLIAGPLHEVYWGMFRARYVSPVLARVVRWSWVAGLFI